MSRSYRSLDGETRRFARTLIIAGAAVCAVAASGIARSGVDRSAPASAELPHEMSEAAGAYLGTLDAAGRDRGTWSLEDDARFDWHFVPREREGMPLKDMTDGQRAAAHGLLHSILSSQGYLKATGVMQLEGILGAIEGRPERRDPEGYYVSIFGSPSVDSPWAWRYEGHHLSLNFTAAPGEFPSVTPAFMGSNPHVVPEGPSSGMKLMGAEEAHVREVLAALSADELSRATIADEAPSDIVTGNARAVELDAFEGIPVSEMSAGAQGALLRLLAEYVLNVDSEVARFEMGRIQEAGLDRLHFAWAGSLGPGEGHYFRIHGPTILIEYDNVQGGANHVHTVWRDPENDFGDDLLRRHYEEAEHHQHDR
ncbi:MAG: DUF3500 domain-containing protein [Gemmatimonadota bacterium]|nr:DUF3500 domain-containing protein [Gemmatimonadota bacterium]